ncbi:MAG: Eco57I restriction-modification methylase domain-containing protein [Bacteroidales bacterium]|nr:Eco57I restriction-modification methylase domain-containing protein [Bacteroidales bacterium]
MESGNDLILKNALEQFADNKFGILDASLNLLKQIVGADKFTLGSQKPRSVKDLCLHRNVTYQQILNEVVDNIKSTYYVARLDDRAFSKHTDAVELESALDDASEEKYKGILVFAIDVDENTKVNRTIAAELTRVFNQLSNNPVILFIRQGFSLSISTCERTTKKRDFGEKMGKVNLLQNINCSKPATGHLRILESLQINSKIKTFDALYEHWFEVFNTKTLTDKFYKELYSWYMWVVNDPNTHFPENAQLPEHENEKKNVKIIRLITRMLFVWFIKAKKVKKEGQPEMGLVPEKLFEIDELKAILNDFNPSSETNGEFYNAILQNLFFATLNNEVNSRQFVDTSNAYRSKKGYTVKNLYRDNKGDGNSWFKISHDEVLDLFKTVPFLNCGLFECLDKYKRTDISYDVDRLFDGFSTKNGEKFRACLPNRLFFADELPEITIQVTEKGKKVPLHIKSKGLINLLNEYVFTVEENTPLDQQVSLDPELLGKVFENLLAAYNPETEESARKSSGSYYTPREIVEYMVNESLIQYLKTNLNADEVTETQLRNLVSPSNPKFELSPNQQDAILEALYHCRILDPACGSGAFPMGMLQQMVHIISRLDDKNAKWQELITKKATEETTKAYENKELTDEERNRIIDEIKETFTNNKNNPDYTRKLYLIQNCIFGVDIQPIAMMISKLRFFISLICEQDENAINFKDVEHNFGIHTLPNLETKFVAANSLLTPDVKKYTGNWTNDEHLDQLKNELMELRYRHVTARSLKDKMEVRTLDDEKRQEINEYILSTQAHADPVKIAMFEDQIAHLMLERELYRGENFVEEYVDVQGDLFADSERKLVRKDANRAKRDDIDRQIRVCQAQIDHEKAKENITGFEAAVKQLTEWNPYDQVKSSPFFDPDWMFGITDGFDIVIGNPPYISVRTKSFDSSLKPLYKALYNLAVGQYDLYTLFIEMAYKVLSSSGILSFIIPTRMLSNENFMVARQFVMNNIPITHYVNAEKPFDANVEANIMVCKKGASKPSVSCAKLEIDKNIFIPVATIPFDSVYQMPFCIFPFVFTQDKLNVLFHIQSNKFTKQLSYYLDITRGFECGYDDSSIGVGRYSFIMSESILPYIINQNVKMTCNPDFNNVSKYKTKDVFCKVPKLLTKFCSNVIQFAIDDVGYCNTNSVYNCALKPTANKCVPHLMGVLNSKLITFWFNTAFLNIDTIFPHIQKNQLESIPIFPDIATQKPISTFVDKILVAKKNNPNADTSKWEDEIDQRVYALYGLTYDEVLIVDPDFRLNKEAYEKLLAEI